MVVGEEILHEQNDEGSELVWNYQLVISILQLPSDKTG